MPAQQLLRRQKNGALAAAGIFVRQGRRAKDVVERAALRPSTIALWHFMNASSSCERIMFSSLRGSPIKAVPCELRARSVPLTNSFSPPDVMS